MRKLLITICFLLVCSTGWATDYTQDANCEGAWLFTEGSGTTVADSSANTNTGNFKGAGEPAWDTTDVSFAVSGAAPNSVDFDEVDDYINAGTDTSIDDITTKTIVFWLYMNTLPAVDAEATYVSKFYNSGSAGYGWQISAGSAGTLGYYNFWNNSWGGYSWASGQTLSAEQWYHIAITIDNSSSSNTAKFYIDGTEYEVSSTGSEGGSRSSDANGNLSFGGRAGVFGEHVLDGLMTEIAIFSRILSEAEINAIMNYGLTGATGRTGLIMVMED